MSASSDRDSSKSARLKLKQKGIKGFTVRKTRVEDVNADNTILSTQLFDKDLRHTSKGTVREATRRGWLSHLLDAVNPF